MPFSGPSTNSPAFISATSSRRQVGHWYVVSLRGPAGEMVSRVSRAGQHQRGDFLVVGGKSRPIYGSTNRASRCQVVDTGHLQPCAR